MENKSILHFFKILFILALVVFSCERSNSQIISQEFLPSDWGIDNLSDICSGEVKIVYKEEENRFVISKLRNTARAVIEETTKPENPDFSGNNSILFEENRLLHKALWVWTTSKIIDSPSEKENFLSFLDKESFDQVFLQIPSDSGDDAIDEGIGFKAGKLRPLILELNKRNIKVYALDGSKNYTLPENHQTVVDTVEKIIRYNEKVNKDERFYGIHYDIEPYLLPGFNGDRQKEILQNYIDIIKKITSKAKEGNLFTGLSIPFWFDSPDRYTGEEKIVEVDGIKKPLIEHIIDLVDTVAIMDYRTEVNGSNGIIALAEKELSIASQKGKEVLIGLETGRLSDERVFNFEGLPEKGLPLSAPEGNLFFIAEDDGKYMGYFVVPEDFKSFEDFTEDEEIKNLLYWHLDKGYMVKGDTLSFCNLGADRLFEVTEDLESELKACPAFSGFAIHHYNSYSTLVNHN